MVEACVCVCVIGFDVVRMGNDGQGWLDVLRKVGCRRDGEERQGKGLI
jgi:hypothetical protein